jgi:hypothetical protein
MSNRKQILPLLAIILITVFAWGCKKSTDAPKPIKGDIYISGYLQDSITSTMYHPFYWKNGAIVMLSYPNYGRANSIFVTDSGDVYVGGELYNESVSDYTPVYWKNGVVTKLTNYYQQGAVTDVKVGNGNVYVSGYIGLPPPHSAPMYWINGVLHTLTANGGIINSIALQGNDVYLGGSISNDSLIVAPIIWKNENIHFLDTHNLGCVYSIAANGNDIIAAGLSAKLPSFYYCPAIWQNGNRTLCSDLPGAANHVFFSDNSSYYISGYISDSTTFTNRSVMVWQYYNDINFNSVSGQAHASAIVRNKLYTIGTDNDNYLKLWVNGQDTTFMNNLKGVATSIFIK